MRVAVLSTLLTLSVTAAGGAPLRTAASVPPVAALVRLVGGEIVTVQVLLPPGASPHGYEPDPQSIRSLAEVEVLFTVGRDLDGWAESIARGANPDIRIERLGNGLPGPEPAADPSDPEGDPHVWMDPVKGAAMARAVTRVLEDLRPGAADTLAARESAAADTLTALDRYCAARLAAVRRIPFAAFHGGLNHLVARYGLDQVAVLEPFPGRDPSPRYLMNVVDVIEKTKARVIFAEPQFSSRLAEVAGKETGVPVVEIDVIGGVPGRLSYTDLIRSDVRLLVSALGGTK